MQSCAAVSLSKYDIPPRTNSTYAAYKGLLKCSNDQIHHQKLHLSKKLDIIDLVDRPWIERAIHPDRPVVFLDTDRKGWVEADGAQMGAGGPINRLEASVVSRVRPSE